MKIFFEIYRVLIWLVFCNLIYVKLSGLLRLYIIVYVVKVTS